jgi:hypothetical protein
LVVNRGEALSDGKREVKIMAHENAEKSRDLAQNQRKIERTHQTAEAGFLHDMAQKTMAPKTALG